MKQKMVVKVEMNCQKCRTKALKIVASLDGVDEVKLDGEEKDKVVVIGENVDSIRLTKSLRKKVGYAYILTLDEVKPKTSEEKISTSDSFQYYHHPQFVGYDMVYEPTPGNCCFM